MQRKLVLFGHQLDEYEEMFALSPKDFDLSILEYGSGITAVNKTLSARNKKIISIDPSFSLNKKDLANKSTEIFNQMIKIVKNNASKFNFSKYSGLNGLIAKRREGIKEFFKDYENGKKQLRYLPANHDSINFKDFTFDYALSSHYFFAGDDNEHLQHYIKIIKELARVAKEVRIFPLIDKFGQPSPLLGPILLELQNNNYGVEVREVDYHLQPQGNAMLRVFAKECKL